MKGEGKEIRKEMQGITRTSSSISEGLSFYTEERDYQDKIGEEETVLGV